MKPEILIVEDDIVIYESIALDLRNENYKVYDQCETGEKALDILKDQLPDLILMDIKLKGDLNGIEVAKQISNAYNIPIIYLTDSVDNKTFQNAKKTYPENYLTKPFQTHQLLMVIELALDIKPGASSTPEFGFFRNTDKEEIKVKYGDILFLKSDKVYCHVILKDKKFTISQPMKTVHKRIPFKDIIRVSKSYCINKNQVDKIIGNTIFIGNERITVGDTYRQILNDFNFIK